MNEEEVEFSTFNSLEELKKYCKTASKNDLEILLEILDVKTDLEYIMFIKSILK